MGSKKPDFNLLSNPVYNDWRRRKTNFIVFIGIVLMLSGLFLSIKTFLTRGTQPSQTSELESELVLKPGESKEDAVKRLLNGRIRALAGRTDEEKLSILRNKSERLQSLVSENAIDQIAKIFQYCTGTKQRAFLPDPNIPIITGDLISGDNFDNSTALLYDVIEIRIDSTEEVSYVGVLLDSQGRTVSIKLTPENGKKFSSIFKLINQYSLMSSLYRKIVMPIIDKQLEDYQGEWDEL